MMRLLEKNGLTLTDRGETVLFAAEATATTLFVTAMVYAYALTAVAFGGGAQ